MRRASRPTSPIRSTTSTAPCGGASGGRSVPSKPGTRSASNPCSRRARSTDPPAIVRDLLASGRTRFRDDPLPAPAGLTTLQSIKARSKIVKTNAGASLVDLGDGVLGVEFHSKMNTLGGDAIAMLQAGVREAAANFTGLVVGNDAEHFSAGANLMLLLLEAQDGNWDEIDLMVRAFQSATMALKTSAVPVVAAPAGLALGGGCEMCLHTDRRAGGGGNLHGAGRGRGRTHPGRRGHEGNVVAGRGPRRRRRCRTPSPGGVRDDGVRARLDQRRRRRDVSATCVTWTA